MGKAGPILFVCFHLCCGRVALENPMNGALYVVRLFKNFRDFLFGFIWVIVFTHGQRITSILRLMRVPGLAFGTHAVNRTHFKGPELGLET